MKSSLKQRFRSNLRIFLQYQKLIERSLDFDQSMSILFQLSLPLNMAKEQFAGMTKLGRLVKQRFYQG